MTEQIPGDTQRAARIALAVLVGVLGTALVAGGLWLAFRPAPTTPPQTEIEPAEPTTESTATPRGSSVSTATTAPANSSVYEGTDKKPDGGLFGFGSMPRRAARVAFRKDGKIWVAGENGRGAVAVTYGYRAYSLSPDGKRLAVVPDSTEPAQAPSLAEKIAVLNVKRAAVDAAPETPSWAGTSTWLGFTGNGGTAPGAFRIDAGGTALRRMASPATAPKASPDGKSVCFSRPSASGGVPSLAVASATGGSAKTVVGSEGATSWVWGADGAVLFARSAASRGTWDLLLSVPPYSESKVLGSLELAPPAFALTDLSVSRDGRRVLASAMGDDDYSRVWVFDTKDARFHTIQTRRDAYPYGWSADGSRILYFEGNAYQGETTSLMSCRADGSRRRVLVEGAAP